SRVFAENLLEECHEVSELGWLLQRRATAHVTANYEGTTDRMLIGPIPGLEPLPWALVVYRDMLPTRLAQTQILLDVMVLVGAYMALSALLYGTFWVIWKLHVLPYNPFSPALWSRPRAGHLYATIAGVVALIIEVLAMRSGPSPRYGEAVFIPL